MSTDVSHTKRLLQVTSAVLFNVACAGVIFGFAALKPVLVKEGAYADLCSGDNDVGSQHGEPCDEQDLQLNFMFTVATVVTNVAALPVGVLLDKIGPRATTLLGAVAFFAGNVLFPLNYRTRAIDTYFMGFILLALGGPLIFLPSFHLSNTFPLKAGLILSCIIGGFDASSVPYLIYQILYKRLGRIRLRHFFWGYSIIPLLLIVAQLTLAPRRIYQRRDFIEVQGHTQESTEDTVATGVINGDSSTVVGSSQNSLNDEEFGVHKGVDEGGDRIIGAMFGKSAKEQILNRWFGAILLFLCIYMSRINYLIQTVGSQLSFYLVDHELANSITTVFTVLLPLGGIAGIPFVGWLLDQRTMLEGSNVILAMGMTYGALGLLSTAGPHLISISIFVVLRPLMYTYVGDYCGKVFGYEHFGTVYGLANAISGVFGLVLRPIDVFVKFRLGGNYTPVNVVGLLIGLLASGMLSTQIWRGVRGIALE